MASYNSTAARGGGYGSDCTRTHYPSQGGDATAASLGYEGAGEPGDKEPMPSPPAATPSDEGNHDLAALSAHAASHGLPAVSHYPDNLTGSIEAGNPTAAEGAGAMAEYPHAGPPARTWSTGGGNPGTEGY